MQKLRRTGTLSSPIYWNEEGTVATTLNTEMQTVYFNQVLCPNEDNGKYEVEISVRPIDIGRTSAYMGNANYSLEVEDVDTQAHYFITKSKIPEFFGLMSENSVNGVVTMIATLTGRNVLIPKSVVE